MNKQNLRDLITQLKLFREIFRPLGSVEVDEMIEQIDYELEHFED